MSNITNLSSALCGGIDSTCAKAVAEAVRISAWWTRLTETSVEPAAYVDAWTLG